MQEKVDKLDTVIAEKQAKLDWLNEGIAERTAQLRELNAMAKSQAEKYLEFNRTMQEEKRPYYEGLVGQIMAEKYKENVGEVLGDMSDQWKEELEENDSFLTEMQEREDDVKNVAMLMIQGYMDNALTAANVCGGRAVKSDLPWRDPKDDDMAWARKCFDAAVKMTRPKGRRQRLSIGHRR